MKKVLFNWSGGKDSSLCLYKLLSSGNYEVSRLITTINKEKGRIFMHGVREELLELQADRLGLPLHKVFLPARVSMVEYDRVMGDTVDKYKTEIEHAVFGDIFLESLRNYREKRLKETGITALFPLWKQSTTELAREFIALGFKAVVVCVDGRKLNHAFAGREYDRKFLKDLPGDVDPCGEYGEFHTFVYDGPIFSGPVPFNYGETVRREYKKSSNNQEIYQHTTEKRPAEPVSTFWFCDLMADA